MTSVLVSKEEGISKLKRRLTKQFDSDKEDKQFNQENGGK